MRFYTKTHQHYCGIDLHAKTMYLCILAVECMFTCWAASCMSCCNSRFGPYGQRRSC